MSRKLFQTGFVLAIMLFCLNCRPISEIKPRYSGEESNISPQIFQKLGYQVKNSNESLPNDWLRENFQTEWVRTYQVKSQTSLKEQSDTFPRYTIVEEVYKTPELAAKRLERIQEKPTNLSAEQDYYRMVTGFQHGKNIYFIQTDASVFDYYMKDFAENLNEELSRDY